MIEAVIFDMDGVLVDTEQLWERARAELTLERGGVWHEQAQPSMMGMSSTEWSNYMHDELAVPDDPDWINGEVVRRLARLYRERLPVIDGAIETVRRLDAGWPLAIASSSNRPLLDLVLELTGLERNFDVTVSSEEVERGKPAPYVYLAAAAGLQVEAASCAAVEDSSNGLRAAASAGMRVIAVPNQAFPPSPDALAQAHAVLPSIADLNAELLE